MPTLVENRRIHHEYEILERYTAGITLTGSEVRSVREGHASLSGAFVTIHGGEAFLTNAFIASYKPSGGRVEYDPNRSRKLLLKRNEIDSLIGARSAHGLTIVPIQLYTHKSLIKLEIALARGLKKHDKRELLKRRDDERKIRKAMRGTK